MNQRKPVAWRDPTNPTMICKDEHQLPLAEPVYAQMSHVAEPQPRNWNQWITRLHDNHHLTFAERDALAEQLKALTAVSEKRPITGKQAATPKAPGTIPSDTPPASAVSSIEPRLAELLRDLYVAFGQCMAEDSTMLVYDNWHKRLEPFVLGKAAPSSTRPIFEDWWRDFYRSGLDRKKLAHAAWDSAALAWSAHLNESSPSATGPSKDAERLDWLERWLDTGRKRGFQWNGFRFSTGATIREQLDRLMAPLERPRDWTEDASHENGNYTNTCGTCGKTFIGHKRRVTCKVCHVERGSNER